MYRLYAAPNTYAMGVQAMLEEIGADYELCWVELFADRPDPAFLAASPHARVPALVGPDGALFETGAIALYLAERHPEAGLLVPPGDPRRGRYLQWLHYLASTLQPEVLIQYHPEFYFTDPATAGRLVAASAKRLAKVLGVIDAALAPGPYFFAAARTACDYCFGMQAVWPEIYPGRISDYPNIERLVRRLMDRPAVQRVLLQHAAKRAGGDARRHAIYVPPVAAVLDSLAVPARR